MPNIYSKAVITLTFLSSFSLIHAGQIDLSFTNNHQPAFNELPQCSDSPSSNPTACYYAAGGFGCHDYTAYDTNNINFYIYCSSASSDEEDAKGAELVTYLNPTTQAQTYCLALAGQQLSTLTAYESDSASSPRYVQGCNTPPAPGAGFEPEPNSYSLQINKNTKECFYYGPPFSSSNGAANTPVMTISHDVQTTNLPSHIPLCTNG